MEFNNPLTLFQHLLSIDEDKTLENLNSLIKEDHSFYLEAKELIAAHKKNKENTVFNELINDKATILVNDDSIHKLEGKQVGYYKLTKKLGQGGMGAVYLGERNDGQIEQKVAIKFVYPSIVSLAGEDFLQKEAQHLANLEHTNIAKIYTIDITEDDIPYMVMEFVDGVTIDKYFKYKKLNLKTRLKTFQKVCNAVHNAHQNMVIHADIKPSNILIDNQGEPKLMDFGISRSLSDTKELKIKSGELSLNAASRNFSSPEQVSGEELSISTDVFSLGKLLSSLCKESNFKDLNYVINRCIQPKITERYNSVAQIEDDIKNLLNNQPISLRKNENLYILSKLFSRHYVSSTIAITFFITIVFGSVMLSINNTRLAKEVVRSNQLSSFLKELISAGDPIFSQGEELKVKDLIIDGANKISTQLGDNIEDKVLLTNLLARSLINLGSYKDSIAILSNLSFKADTSPIYIAETKLNLAVALKLQSELEPALKNLLEAKEILESYKETDIKSGPLKIQIHQHIAEVFSHQDKMDAAQSEIQLALKYDIKNKNFIPPLLDAYVTASQIYLNMGNFKKATEYVKKAIKLENTSHKNLSLVEITSYITYGDILSSQSLWEEALEKYQLSNKKSLLLFGKDHPFTAGNIRNIAFMEEMMGSFDDAIQHYEQALSIIDKHHGKQSLESAEIINDLAIVSQTKGDYTNALMFFDKAQKIYTKRLGSSNSEVATMLSNKATVYADLGLFNKEIELYKQSIKIAEAAFGREHPTIAIRLSNIAQSYLDQGQVAQGWPYIEESILISKKIFGSVHKRTADHMSVLGNYLIESGKFEEAESTLKEVINILKEIQKTENHISIASAHNSLGTLADRSGNFNKAEYHFSKAIDVAANSIGNDHKQTNTFRGNLALTLIKIKRWDLAEDILGKLTLYYETNHLLKNHPDAIRATAITQCLTSLNHICEV